MSCPMLAGTTPTAITFFVVYQRTGTNANTALVSRTSASWIPRPFDIYNDKRTTGGLNGTAYSFKGQTSAFNIATDANTNIFVASATSGSYKEWINGSQQASLASNTIFNDTDANSFYIATREGNYTQFIGYISEILVYNVFLTDNNRMLIEDYLRSKWSI